VRQKPGAYDTIASCDVEKLSDPPSENGNDLSRFSTANAATDPAPGCLVQKINKNVAKITKYLKQELEGLP